MLMTAAHNHMLKHRGEVSELQAVRAEELNPQMMKLLGQATERRAMNAWGKSTLRARDYSEY